MEKAKNYLKKLNKFYGEDVFRQFCKLKKYMVDVNSSFNELMDRSIYERRGISNLDLEDVLKSKVPSVLREYEQRIKTNIKLGITPEIEPGDIEIVLRSNIMELEKFASKKPTPSLGRRVYTGNNEHAGCNPGAEHY